MTNFKRIISLILLLSFLVIPVWSKDESVYKEIHDYISPFYMNVNLAIRAQKYCLVSPPAQDIYTPNSWGSIINQPNSGEDIVYNFNPSFTMSPDVNFSANLKSRSFIANPAHKAFPTKVTNNSIDSTFQFNPTLTLQANNKNSYFQIQAGKLNKNIASYSGLLLNSPGRYPFSPFLESDQPQLHGFVGKFNFNSNTLEVFNGYTFYPGTESRQVYGGHLSKTVYLRNSELKGGISYLEVNTNQGSPVYTVNRVITGDISYHIMGSAYLRFEAGQSEYSPNLNTQPVLKSGSYKASIAIPYLENYLLLEKTYEQPQYRVGIDNLTLYSNLGTGNVERNRAYYRRYIGKKLSLYGDYTSSLQLNSTVFDETGILNDDNIRITETLSYGLSCAFNNGGNINFGFTKELVKRNFAINNLSKLDYANNTLDLSLVYPLNTTVFLNIGTRTLIGNQTPTNFNDITNTRRDGRFAGVTYLIPNSTNTLSLTYKNFNLATATTVSNIAARTTEYYGNVEAVEFQANFNF